MTFDCSIIGLSLLLFITCTWSNSVVGEQQFIEKPPLYQEVSSGDDVQLPCTVQDKRGQCIWQKDRRPVGMHPDKYEWASGRGSDCTLLIRRASLHFDDGLWECQVTSSDFIRQDALSSEQSRLLVRVKPRKPQLEYGGAVLGATLTLQEGQEALISCVSRYGNPPALIKWFIGNDEVEPLGEQNNATEVDNRKTWAAHSLLRVRGQRENHGLPIRCVTVHPSSLTPANIESRLDVHYSPEVRLETSPQPLTVAPEDSANFLSLKCLADANPVASIKWFKDSVPLDASLADTSASSSSPSLIQSTTAQLNDSMWGAELRFEPVKRHDAGLYSCKAANIIGESAPASYRLDVQYEPKLKRIENDTSMDMEETALLSSSVELFECPEFEANPPAQYKWVHLRGSSTETIENHVQNKGGGRRLRLENIMWSDEGEYRCIAFNTINGVKRETASDVHYVLHVTGPPEIQARPLPGDRDFYESIGWAGEPVHRLKSRFCSRPPPKLVAWQWGSSHIRAGENIHPKYEALPLEPIVENKMVTNCYWAKLEIKDLQKEDARIYTLLVESEKGRDSRNIKLIVRDPTEMRVIAAAVAVGLLFLLLLISIGVYSLLRIRRGRYRQEMMEEGSIAADALYNGTSINQQKSINSSHAKTFTRKSSLDNGQSTYDYNHIAKQTRAMSPEALKVRRAPAVLQPPTIV
ncbi:hemicentin-2-like isoform X1 [Cataglyphis hispanica]|uniref:hemicentin-2-like isoform X1 n=1 Tax=Cataglyphis hispanica TaxID=1086592 RepID=UPI00217F6D58|nr:hemicentin-2-like isoform X1 [Cataglyphis hispanica]